MSQPILAAIGDEILEEMYLHAEDTYPSECCGVLLGQKGINEIHALRRCKNVYDLYHEEDPFHYPRTSKTAYLIDPKELLAIQKETRTGKTEMKAIYHSHVEVGAYFSDEDKRVATFENAPLFPGVAYIVVSCRKGRSDGAALFSWDDTELNFVLRKTFTRSPDPDAA